jgi:hypothetical protein
MNFLLHAVTAIFVLALYVLFSYGFYVLWDLVLGERRRSINHFQIFASWAAVFLWCVFWLAALRTQLAVSSSLQAFHTGEVALLIALVGLTITWLIRPVWFWLTPDGAYLPFRVAAKRMLLGHSVWSS